MPGTRHELLERIEVLHERVTAAVAGPGTHEPPGDHPLRGLYLSREQAVGLLTTENTRTDDNRAPLGPARLGPALATLARRGGLDALDLDILVVALAVDIEPSYEKLYGFIHDDLTRRRPTIGLAMELCGLPTTSWHRQRFEPDGALRTNELLIIEDDDRPFLGRTLRVPDHVTAHLLETVDLDAVLRRHIVAPIDVDGAEIGTICACLERGEAVHLTEGHGGAAAHLAAAAVWAAGATPCVVDMAGLGPHEVEAVVVSAIRHRVLSGDLLVVRAVESIVTHARDRLDQLLAPGGPVVLIGDSPWDRTWSRRMPRHVPIADLADAETMRIWRAALGDAPAADDAVELAARTFRLTPEQILGAATSAINTIAGARVIEFGDLSTAARSHSASGLDRLARRLEPTVRWDDLVLPDDVRRTLDELSVRVRRRDQVMHEWGLGRGWRGRGIAALFAGPSGTGKTTAAEVIAGELGYDMHIVDLSSVVDKYIGETEKRLEVIFTEAERTNTVLLFDEADSIFGKRSEVKDARDRYANIEVSYLLQRIERFSGLAILTTNLGANLDDAFTRRLDLVVDFPRPDAVARERLWRHELRTGVPTDGIDFEFCARAFDLTGGNIRNIVITAAYMAAEAGTPVSMAEIVVAVQREYRKMGRLYVPSEFGAYGALLN